VAVSHCCRQNWDVVSEILEPAVLPPMDGVDSNVKVVSSWFNAGQRTGDQSRRSVESESEAAVGAAVSEPVDVLLVARFPAAVTFLPLGPPSFIGLLPTFGSSSAHVEEVTEAPS